MYENSKKDVINIKAQYFNEIKCAWEVLYFLIITCAGKIKIKDKINEYLNILIVNLIWIQKIDLNIFYSKSLINPSEGTYNNSKCIMQNLRI